MEKKLTKAQDEARKKKNRERTAKYRLSKKNKLPTGGGKGFIMEPPERMVKPHERTRKLPVTTEDTNAGTLTIRIVRTVRVERGGFTYGELIGMVTATVVIGTILYFIV